MIISEKQIMQLFVIARDYIEILEKHECYVEARQIHNLLTKIIRQQSRELKEIEITE